MINRLIKERIEALRRGEVPEGYEKTAFGIFPRDWVKDETFGELFDFYGGLSKSRDELGDEGHAYLHYGDLHKGTFNVVSFEQYKQLPKCAIDLRGGETYLMEDGDVAFLDASEDLEGTSRSVLIDNPDNQPFIAGLHIIYGKPKDQSIFKWYKQYITTTDSVKKQFQKLSAGFKVYGLNRGTLPKIKLSYPKSMAEQERIAEILMQWDKAIELQEKLIEAYRKLKRYCLDKMFPKKGSNVPEVRFPGFTAPWEQRKLGDVVSRFATGLNPRDNFTLNSGGKNYYVTIKNFTHGNLVLDDNCDKIDDEALALIQARSDLRIGDILFSSIGRVGDCFLIENKPINWNINESVFVLRPVKDAVDPLYLMHTIHSERVLSIILSCVTGSTFKSIKMTQLKETNIPYPSIAEQKQIGKFITTIDNLITLHQRKRDKLEAQRKVMQQYLLTGIVRV